ncbi:hypothetical protein BS78_06G085100 [Paspalum vaginatum]|nr:hypothetical protein BS78_06G085100 [Paspalum vaginatum]
MQPEGYAENNENIQPEGGQRSQKRKSPCATMPPFRSPLSRMLLSPRIQLPRALLRSPVAIQNTSPSTAICRGQTTTHTIDLNVQLEGCVQESDENVQPQGYAENDENIQEGYSQEGDKNLLPQENARKNLTLSDEKRRAIFESLLARANNGEITGHEKKRSFRRVFSTYPYSSAYLEKRKKLFRTRPFS